MIRYKKRATARRNANAFFLPLLATLFLTAFTLEDDLAKLTDYRKQLHRQTLALSTIAKKSEGAAKSATLLAPILNRTDKIIGEIDPLVKKLDKRFNSEEASPQGGAQGFQEDKSKIDRYKAIIKYLSSNLAENTGAEQLAQKEGQVASTSPSSYRPYSGTLTIQTGSSTFDAQSEINTTAQNIALDGSYQMSESSSLYTQLSRKSEVIQSAYTNDRGRIGYRTRSSSGTLINTYFDYRGYSDTGAPRNDFSNMGAGVRIGFPLSSSTKLIASADLANKSYKQEGGSDYKGGGFNSGLQFSLGQGSRLDLLMTGRVQSSDLESLNYTRLAPQLRYLKPSGNGSFRFNVTVEQISFGEGASNNNFLKEGVNLILTRGNRKNEIKASAKQYGNNADFNYVKLGTSTRANGRGKLGFSRSLWSALYTLYPAAESAQVNYLDLRGDQSINAGSLFLESNAFARLWQSKERSNLLDWHARLGMNYRGVRVGPILGARLSFTSGEFAIEKDGNSIRTGLGASVYRGIMDASIGANVSYERSIVYGHEISIDSNTGLITRGELLSRNPTTLQYSFNFRMPVMDLFDFTLDARKFDIDMDIDDSVSINPIPNRSNFKLLAGIVYNLDR